MSEELQKLANSYADTFGENFPAYLFQDYTETQLLELLTRCVETHKTAEELTGRDYEAGDY